MNPSKQLPFTPRVYEAYSKFTKFERVSGMTIEDYILDFVLLYEFCYIIHENLASRSLGPLNPRIF